jgi:hypothetical protein
LRKPERPAQACPVVALKPPKLAAKPETREARLAAALRANLKRRKAQERERAGVPESSTAPTQAKIPKSERIG